MTGKSANYSRGHIRVLFVIRSLERGGAEGQLVSLMNGILGREFEVAVLTLYDGGALSSRISQDVTHISLRKRARWDLIAPLWRAVWHVRRLRPHVIHGYLPVGNILALILGRTVGAKVVWGIRASRMDVGMYDWLNRATLAIALWCSRWVDLIISNSQSGAEDHVHDGFPAKRMVVIPNGIDAQRFRPNANARAKLRELWTIGDQTFLLGHVGRVDPVKDHALLFRAAAEVFARQTLARERMQIACVVSGPRDTIVPLESLVEQLGLSNQVRWLWNVDRMEDVYVAFDGLAMTSNAEGFPNVVAEAMASGVPCVATDVGDTEFLLGDCGFLVPPREVSALANGITRLLAIPPMQRAELGTRARERVVSQFELGQLVTQTQRALQSLIGHDGESPPAPRQAGNPEYKGGNGHRV